MPLTMFKNSLLYITMWFATSLAVGVSCGQNLIAGYDFSDPDRVMVLAKSLSEISGLASGPKGQLYAVQDEKGTIFQLNPEDGSILAEQKFYGSGDFEGIERIGNVMFILRSSGHLFEVELGQKARSNTVRKSRLKLPAGCDAEALGSDIDVGTLWVACKNADGVKGKRTRSLFRLSANEGKWENDFVLSIDQKMLNDSNGASKWSIGDFMPSGLTLKGDITFVLSAVSDLLLVIQPHRTDIIELSALGLKQAEGIAIDREGTLYIASEGAGSRGKILAFRHDLTTR